MAEDNLQTIARELAQRLYDDPSEGAEFVRDALRAVASGLGDRRAEGEYAQKKEIGKHLHEAWRHLNEALAIMHPRGNPARPPVHRNREYQAGAAAYRHLSRHDKEELGDQLVLGEFDWMDWFSDRPHPDFLRGFKDAWNPED